MPDSQTPNLRGQSESGNIEPQQLLPPRIHAQICPASKCTFNTPNWHLGSPLEGFKIILISPDVSSFAFCLWVFRKELVGQRCTEEIQLSWWFAKNSCAVFLTVAWKHLGRQHKILRANLMLDSHCFLTMASQRLRMIGWNIESCNARSQMLAGLFSWCWNTRTTYLQIPTNITSEVSTSCRHLLFTCLKLYRKSPAIQRVYPWDERVNIVPGTQELQIHQKTHIES